MLTPLYVVAHDEYYLSSPVHLVSLVVSSFSCPNNIFYTLWTPHECYTIGPSSVYWLVDTNIILWKVKFMMIPVIQFQNYLDSPSFSVRISTGHSMNTINRTALIVQVSFHGASQSCGWFFCTVQVCAQVPGSDLVTKADCPDWGLIWLLQSSEANANTCIARQIGFWPFHYTFFRNHYSLHVLSFDAMRSESWKYH
jgi:hypothetical protein